MQRRVARATAEERKEPGVPLSLLLSHVDPTAEAADSTNVFETTTGILQVIEKMHISIDQLNGKIGDLSSDLEAKDPAAAARRPVERLAQLTGHRS